MVITKGGVGDCPSIGNYISTAHTRLSPPYSRGCLDLGLVDENPACDPVWTIGGARLKGRLIQFNRDVTDVMRASRRGVKLSLRHGTDTDAHLPNPPTKYIAWTS